MTNKNDDKIYILPFIKRPDLRKDEINILEAESDELYSWQWWIDGYDLYKDELDSDHREIAALDLPDHLNITKELPDPIKIIEAFCSCHDWKVYPPAWVMNYLYSQFSEYLSDNLKGKDKRLGEYFGEPARGSRRGTFGTLAAAHVMEQAMIDIDRFRYWFGVSREDSVELVSQYLQTIKNETSHRFQKGSAAILQAYKKWHREGTSEWLLEVWNKNPPEEEHITAMLKRYHHDSFDAYIGRYPILKKFISK